MVEWYYRIGKTLTAAWTDRVRDYCHARFTLQYHKHKLCRGPADRPCAGIIRNDDDGGAARPGEGFPSNTSANLCCREEVAMARVT